MGKHESNRQGPPLDESRVTQTSLPSLETLRISDRPIEASLPATHEEWEQSFNALTEDVCTLNRAGLILRANKAMRDRFERLHGNLIGRDYRTLYYGFVTPGCRTPWESVLAGALSATVETWLPKLDGWYQVTCYPLFDPEGKQWGAVSVVKDITDRKRIEEALCHIAQSAPAAGSAAFFRSLVLHLAKALDVEYALLAVCEEGKPDFARTIAVSDHGQVANNMEFHLPATPAASVVRGHRCCYPVAVRQQFPDDRLLDEWAIESYISSPLLNAAGRPFGFVTALGRHPLGNIQLAESLMGVFAMRATAELERKNMEDALRDSEERYRAIAEHTYDLICETSATGRFLYASPNYTEVLGYEPGDLIGRSVFDYIHPEDLPAVLATFERGIRTLSTGQAVFRHRHHNGEWRWFESAGKAFMTATKETRGVVVSRDITERKKIEEELLRASKLESLGVLAGGIAHDFNNLLTAIIGNLSLAKTSSNPSAEVVKCMVEAEKAALRAKGLTQQLLAFAKGGAPIRKTTAIGPVLREAAGFALPGSKVRCEFHLPEDLWMVEIDEGQISQVINNLVINAQQAMPEGGIISILGENLTLNTEKVGEHLPFQQGRYLKISITDQGTGIKKEHLPRIFDPYFTTKQRGSGLGLATAYTIIKNHEGYITVRSDLGVGTTFALYLPASFKELPSLPNRHERSLMGKGKILVMDDEESIRELLVQMLSYCGYEPAVASDGETAILLYTEAQRAGRPFNAVIMDLTIPGLMGGKETIHILRDIDPDVKAIVSSGYANDPVMAEFRKYGFHGVVAKPYQIEELSEVLQAVLEGKIP